MKTLLRAKDMGEVTATLQAAVLHLLYEQDASLAPEFPESDDVLHAWIKERLGIHVPRKSVCDGHSAAFDFIADAFFGRISDGLELASRAGGKTQDAAVLHVCNGYFKPGHATSHIGAIQNQAKRCYTYYRQALKSNEELNAMADDPHIESTIWSNGSVIEILPGTEAQTQGGHPHTTTYDEIEQGKYQPLENSKGMSVEYIDVHGKKWPGQWLGMSTRQDGLGMMQSVLDDFNAKGLPVYTRCVWETLDGSTCFDEAGAELCASCPLFDAGCEGKAKVADGWRSRDEIERVWRRSTSDTWDAQHRCVKPESKSLVYANWSTANVSEDAGWQTALDEDRKPHPLGPLYVWYDWGFTDDTHIGLMQHRGGAFHLFDELTGTQTSEREWVQALVRRITELEGYDGPTYATWEKYWAAGRYPDKWPSVWPDLVVGDPSAVQLRNELRQFGFNVSKPDKVIHKVESGQDVFRAAILTAGKLRRLYAHPRCSVFLRCIVNFRTKRLEDGSFSKLPDPQPANHRYSHPLDGGRYFFWRVRKSHLGLEVASDAELVGE